jgi:hypothetical protein
MICKKYKCIFVHVPKTAGQSIEVFFLNLLGRTGKTRNTLLLRKNMDPSRGPFRLSHLTAAEYVQYGYIAYEDFASFFKFGFIRNPWDRVVSEYHFRQVNSSVDFKTFVLRLFSNPATANQYRHIIPQSHFLYDANGKLLVDKIGRFENLRSDFAEICEHLQIPATDSHLPHCNKAHSRRPYLEYYDNESRHAVAEFYHLDIELFGYTFGSCGTDPAP